MTRGTQFLFAMAAAFSLLASPPMANAQEAWRFWTSADGLAESFSQALSFDSEGRLWARHGATTRMSVLDGYSVTQMRDPRDKAPIHWDLVSRVEQSAWGDAWAVEDEALKRYHDHAWSVRYKVDSPRERLLEAIPASPRRVIALFSDRVAEWNDDTGRFRTLHTAASSIGPFTAMIRGFTSEIWIAGAHGVARLDILPAAGEYAWTERDTRNLGLSNLASPSPGAGEEVFFSGGLEKQGLWAALRWHGSTLEILRTSKRPLRGWRGPDQSLWFLDGETLLCFCDGREEKVERRGVLAGTIATVTTEPGGAFFVTTTDGIARYTPLPWRTPAPIANLDEAVHGAIEDARGRLWFMSYRHLIRLDSEGWKVYPYPDESVSDPLQTDSLTESPNGLIALRVRQPRRRLLTFDPRTERFHEVIHPQGFWVWVACRQKDGTLLATASPERHEEDQNTIVSFDGERLRTVAVLGDRWKGGDIRSLVADPDGAIWIGGTAGAGALRNGKLKMFGPADGYRQDGAFSLLQERPGAILAGGRTDVQEYRNGEWSVRGAGFDRVRSMMRSSDGAFWVAASSGVYRLYEGVQLAIGEADGLPSDTALKIFEDSHGRLWVGSNRGLALFHPEADIDPPRTFIASQGNSPEAPASGDVTVLFSGIDKWKMTVSERLFFSHNLDGRGWSPFTLANSASFSGLPHGRHVFQVRAMDRSGHIDPSPAVYEFTVALHWRRQPVFLFIAAAGLFAVVAMFSLAGMQYRAVKRAKLAAEEASRAKSEFLANMSHEIRTPMNAIIGVTALAAETPHDAQRADYLRTVQASARGLLALLDDILDIAKVEAGKLELSPVHFDLHACVDDAVRTMRPRAEEKGLELASWVDPHAPVHLFGDDLRLQRILLNLLDNAIKFTEQGRVSIRVELISQSDAEAALRFTVADTGVGVPPEKQKTIFAPFEQAGRPTCRRYGGAGLGLSISAKLVGLMHGVLIVESPWTDPATGEKVAGSAFSFTAAFGRGRRPQSAAASSAHAPAGSLRVLLAEDDSVNQALDKRLLESLGHQVAVASSGCEAVEVIERGAFDVALMDVQAPQMNGWEAVAAIRRREREAGLPRLPIIGLTANAAGDDPGRRLDAGVDACLAKPIQPERLAEILARVTHARAV